MAKLDELPEPAGGSLESMPDPEAKQAPGLLERAANVAGPALRGLGRRALESSDPVQQLRTLFTGQPSIQSAAVGDKPASFTDRARSALQGATLNHADEATSALDSLFGPKKYTEALAENRPAYATAVKNAPEEYLGAAIASPNPINKLKAPASLGRLGRIATPMVQSGLMGGVAAEGASNERGLDAGSDAAKGVFEGAALGLGGGLVSEGLRSLSPALKRQAEEQAFKALGARVDLGSGKGKLKAIDARAPSGDPLAARRELGRRALDENVVRPFGTAQGAAERAEPALEQAGEVQGGLLQSIQDQHPGARVSLPAVGTDLERQGNSALMMPSGADTGNALLKRSKEMRDAAMRRQASGLGDYLSLPEAEAEKRALQARSNYAITGADQAAGEEARKRAASAMRQAIENEVEAVGGPDELEPWLAAKKKTGQLADILDVAQQGAQRQSTHVGGPTVFGAAQMAMRHHNGPMGALAEAGLGTLSNAWKQRRPATLAHALDEAANVAKGPTASTLSSRGGTLAEYLDMLNKKEQP